MLDGGIPRGDSNKFKVKNRVVGVGYPGLSYYLNIMNVAKYSISLKNKIREISLSGRMTDWEKGFLNNKQVLESPTSKQKLIINKMYDKYIVKYERRNR